jgi:hypothetical protein
MIKHIVSFKFKDSSKDKIDLVKEALEGLPKYISEIKCLEVGVNISKAESAYDLVLVSEFDDLEALETYRIHPKHQEVLNLINKYKSASMVVDYNM